MLKILTKIQNQKSIWCVLIMLASAAAAVVGGFLFQKLGFPETTIVLLFTLSVLLCAVFTKGTRYGLISVFLAALLFNYFFTRPYYTLMVSDPSDWIIFAIMMFTAWISSMLVSLVKQSALNAARQEEAVRTMYELACSLNKASRKEEILSIAKKTLDESLHTKVSFEKEDLSGAEQPESEACSDQNQNQKKNKGLSADSIQRQNPAENTSPNSKASVAQIPLLSKNTLLGTLYLPENILESESELQKEIMHGTLENTILALDRNLAMEKQMKSEEQARSEQFKSSLLRSISHDLRTPLAGIEGASYILSHSKSLSQNELEAARGICEEADWLQRMVENILSLTKVQEGKLEIKKEMIPADELLEAAASKAERIPGSQRVSYQLSDEVILIPCDPNLIVQMLLNLIANSIEHTSKNGHIRVSVEKENNQAIFRVVNDGTSIDSEDLPHLFETFYTKASHKADSKKGTGLGLSICKAIAQGHGGSIEARNLPDQKGVEFLFRIPLKQEEPSDSEMRTESEEKNDKSSSENRQG